MAIRFFSGMTIGTLRVLCLLGYPFGLVLESGIPFQSKLSSVIHGIDWHWPAGRSKEMVELQSFLCDQIHPTLNDDIPRWIPTKSRVFQSEAI